MDYLDRVVSDDVMRRSLQAARSWGVRPTEFFGEPVATVHTYDPAGRVSKTSRAGWSQEDRNWAEALVVYEAQLCGRGHYLPESMKAENEEKARARNEGLCHECVAIDIESANWADHPHADALVFTSSI